MPGHFLSHFQIHAPNDPKMSLNTKRLRVLHICSTRTPVSNFNLFLTMDRQFRLTDEFESSSPNDRKMTLNTLRSQIFDLLLSQNHKFQSVFHPSVSRFRLTGNVETNAPNTPLMTIFYVSFYFCKEVYNSLQENINVHL